MKKPLYTGASNSVGVSLIKADKFVFQQLQFAGKRLSGLRDVCPALLAASSTGRARAPEPSPCLRPEAASRKLEVVQLLADGEDGINALEGAFRIA